VCDCAEMWLCAGCLGRYPPLKPTSVTAMKLVNEKRECPFGKLGGYAGCSSDGDRGCGTGSGCMMGEGEGLEYPLKLEKKGVFRGWCDWCNGVVLTAEDRGVLEKEG